MTFLCKNKIVYLNSNIYNVNIFKIKAGLIIDGAQKEVS